MVYPAWCHEARGFFTSPIDFDDFPFPKPAQEMKQTCQQLEKQREPQENVDLCKVRPKKRDENMLVKTWFINLMNTLVKIS